MITIDMAISTAMALVWQWRETVVMADSGERDSRRSESAGDFDPRATNVALLQQTQQYLRRQLEQNASDSLLSAAWDEFYRMYSAVIRRFVVAQGVRGADVDDCVQEVWNAVALKLGDFQHPGDRPGLRSWLYSVVRSKATDMMRRQLRHPAGRLEACLEKGFEPISHEPDPGEIMQRNWDASMLRTAIDELPKYVSKRTFQAFYLRAVEERSEAETAEILGLTVEQVRYRKHRAQKKLKSLVAVYTGQPLGAE